MDFEFTEEQKAWRQEVRDFIKENATPELLAEMEERKGTSRGPLYHAWIQKLVERKWLGVGWPVEYGGLGKTAVEQWIMMEEINYAGAPGPGAAVSMMGPTIRRVASEEMKQEWLPRILRGEVEFVLGYSEPNAGTDLASLQTRAVLDGDEFVINGQKIWNSAAHIGTHEWLAVRTDRNAPKHRGISVLIVPMDSPGITVRPLWTWGDVRTNETFFDNVRVPRKNLVGELNMGWYYIASALDFERVAIAPVGRAKRVLDQLVSYAKETRRNGEVLAKDPVVRHKLATLAAEIEICRLFSLRCAWMVEKGLVPNYEASMVKVFNSEVRQRMYDIGMQLMGLYGQLKKGSKWVPLEGEVEESYRGSPVGRFGGGTNEIQRDIIARRGLGLPRG